MPRTPGWRALWPGLMVLTAIVLGIVLVFVYARIGALRGDTYRLYSVTSEARGVLKGTEVWLAGQQVGQVSRIAFRPPSTDTTRRLLLELRILEPYREYIRADTRGQIRSGGTLMGQPVVYLTVGATTAPALAPDDTIVLGPQSDTEGVASQVAAASRVFPEIARNAKLIRDQFMAAGGSFRALDDAGAVEVDLIRSRVGSLTRDATHGEGTIALALRGDLAQRARTVMARADTVRLLLAGERTSLGRFRRDSTLIRSVAELRDDASIVRALLERAEGTAGRALADGAIGEEMAQLERELDLLLDDIRRRPFRYLPF